MDSISQLKFKLNAAKQRNRKLADNMARLPGIISAVGCTPVMDVNMKPESLQLIPFTQLHKHVGSYYVKIKKVLQTAGIITRQNGMWHLREDLQRSGIAVYTTGRLGCYHVYHLKWTPEGAEYVKGIMNQRNDG